MSVFLIRFFELERRVFTRFLRREDHSDHSSPASLEDEEEYVSSDVQKENDYNKEVKQNVSRKTPVFVFITKLHF